MKSWGVRTVICTLFALVGFASPLMGQQLRVESFRNREVVSQEIIVRFRGAAAQATPASVRDTDVAATSVGRSGALLLRSRGRNVATLLEAYANRPDVEYAEPNYVWRARDVPNDPFFKDQWFLKNTGQVFDSQSGTVGADIQAVQAWDIAEGSRNTVVGVLDTGIQYDHPDLQANVWSAPAAFSVTISGQTINCPAGTRGFNAITRTCDPMDDDGHGSHVAGIIGAAGNNGHTVTGISRVASMMGLKFLTAEGFGTTANAIAAIEFAIQAKATFPDSANVRILNASWGGFSFSQALFDEINRAASNGMLFVTAAGNDNKNLDTNPDYPASYNAPNIVVVAATDNRDQRASFSSFGSASVDLGAPGVAVFSTWFQNFYLRRNGTSMSAAMVSGAAALVLSACSLDTQELKTNLMDSVDALPSLEGVTVTGGRLNVNTAVRACAGAPPGFAVTSTPTGQTMAFGRPGVFTVSVTPLNGFSSNVALSVSNLPEGMFADFSPQTLTDGPTTLTMTRDSTLPDGTYLVNILATGDGVTRNAGIVVTAGLPSSCSLVADSTDLHYSERLFGTDAASIHQPGSFADYCSLRVIGQRPLVMTLSNGADDPYLYLLSESGDVIAEDGRSVGQTTISRVLTEGLYFLEVTSNGPAVTGNYTLRVDISPPGLTSFTPDRGVQGTSVDITITGINFYGTVELVLDAPCPGLTISNMVVLNPTTATARLNLPDSVGNCRFILKAPGGISSSINFRMIPRPPTITSVSPDMGMQGQVVPITITGTNFVSGVSINFLYGTLPFPVSVKTVTPTTITLELRLFVYQLPGVYQFGVSTEGGTTSAPFTIVAAPPKIDDIDPSFSGPGQSWPVVIRGTSFLPPYQINAGPDIQVTDPVLVDMSRLEATFTVSPTARLGDHPVTVTTAAGTSVAFIYAVVGPPSISSYSPRRAFLGGNRTVVLTGTNYYCATFPTIEGTDVIVENTPASGPCSSTSKSIIVRVSPTAAVGPRNLRLTGPNGTSNAVILDIVPVPPVIQSMTPTYAGQGTTAVVSVVATDLNLSPISANVSGAGVQVVNTAVNGSTLTATLAIASSAPIGPRNLTVTNSMAESDPVVFTVTPPTWPDLTVRQTLPTLLASGFDETFIFTVRNEGTKETTLPVTVTSIQALPEPPTVSTTSPGWSCSATFQTITCTNPLPIAVNSERVLALTVGMPFVTGGLTVETEVTSVEDYNVSNNKATTLRSIVAPANPRIVVASPVQPGQQATLGIELPTAFHRDIVGTLNTVTLSFSSPSGTPMDPAVQFATGGKTVGYIIRANTLQAEFAGRPGPIGFQTGTVSGIITVNASFQAGNRAPRALNPIGVTVVMTPPSITAATAEKTGDGFLVSVTLFAPGRTVSSIGFQFSTTTPARFSCGGVSGCTASGSSISFNVVNAFNTWYASNTAFGTLAAFRVPFIFQGTISGTVSVTMTSPQGPSNVGTFPLP